jgi:hypothetical protein
MAATSFWRNWWGSLAAVTFFMNKFRKLGFIHYNFGLQVRSSLLNVVLHD